MALFVENVCQLEGDILIDGVSWSPVDPIIAIACSRTDEKGLEKFHILFANNEGNMISNSVINYSTGANVMEWQPNGRVLAIGWTDGFVSCWIVDGKNRPTSTFSNSSQHSSAITVLKWNPSGKRLITGDKSGTVNVWNVDNRGTLTPSRQYRKKSQITVIVFCVIPPKMEAMKRLDWKKTYSPPFFFGTDKGSIIYADDLGHCTEVQMLNSSIDKMLFFEENSRLVIITKSLLLSQYQVADDGRVTKIMQMKLSVEKSAADLGLRSAVWAGPGLLALGTCEKMVRFFDFQGDENYNLSLQLVGDIVDRNDRVFCVAFSPIDRYLAVGTQTGILVIWRYSARVNLRSNEKSSGITAADWEIHYKTSLRAPIRSFSWSPTSGLLTVVTDNSTIVLSETVLQKGLNGDLSVIQVSTTHVSIQCGGSDGWTENLRLMIRGMYVGKFAFVVWDGRSARVCSVNAASGKATIFEPFNTSSKAIVLPDCKDDTIYIADTDMIRVSNYAGVQKASITFSETEGHPEFIHANGKYLFVITTNRFIKVFDMNPNIPKPYGSTFKFMEPNPTAMTTEANLKVRGIKGNITGSRIAILTDLVNGSAQFRQPDTRLHIFDRSKGSVMFHDFVTTSRYPYSVFWDDFDDRLLVCEALRLQTVTNAPNTKVAKTKESEEDVANTKSANDVEGENEFEVVILFASSEHGILLQDSFPRVKPYGDLLGISVPNVIFRNAIASISNAPSSNEPVPARTDRDKVRIFSKVMRDFVGITNIDDTVKSALLEFSFNLTLGKLDEAYKAVKTIDSPYIWENMAQMCIKTKRLDVAEVCLGNMSYARGAAALRESLSEENVDVSVGVLAIQLGLLDDAARCFREANRYDYLNNLYQAAGQWEKAVNIAKTKDRIHLKTTHFHYAQYLESVGDTAEAIHHYEASETFRTEIPRMLFTLGQIEKLEDYIHESNDVALLKWWAAYLESKERYDRACKYYSRAGDYLSLVRILCFQGDFKKASEIVQESHDSAATYHFARQLEAQGELQSAISYYAASGCYNHAIRLAKAYGLDSELMSFAMKATPALMLDCASYFEQKGDLEKAVQLFHKGGDYPRSLDLCFRAGAGAGDKKQSSAMFDMLNTIAQDLGAETSPQTLARCAEFLVQHKQFEKAIELFVMAKRYKMAIDMCVQHRVNVTENMAKLLTPPTEGFDSVERKEILGDLGRALKKQGSFALASNKYTQAGDRVRAMKCLLRGGDTKAIIQFASITRNAEIYKMAANYLQTMDWRDGEIMKVIITFYTKANAFEQLAGFYDSCAQVEIDEYRDYEKALRALKEALKHLGSAKGRHIEDLIQSMDHRIAIIEQFVEARQFVQKNPKLMVQICESLLNEPQLDAAIRVGDCLAMLVEHFYTDGDMKKAYKYMCDMQDRRILLHPYIDADVISKVHKALNIPYAEDDGVEENVENGDEVVEDELEEDIDDDDAPPKNNSKKFGIRSPMKSNSNRNSNRK